MTKILRIAGLLLMLILGLPSENIGPQIFPAVGIALGTYMIGESAFKGRIRFASIAIPLVVGAAALAIRLHDLWLVGEYIRAIPFFAGCVLSGWATWREPPRSQRI